MKNKKMLIGLRNYTADKWKKISVWTTPGGRCDEGETFEVTLRREIYEEVGITNYKIVGFLGQIEGAKAGDKLFVFEVQTKEEAKLMEPDKFSEWMWCELGEIPENFINPRALDLIKPQK